MGFFYRNVLGKYTTIALLARLKVNAKIFMIVAIVNCYIYDNNWRKKIAGDAVADK